MDRVQVFRDLIPNDKDECSKRETKTLSFTARVVSQSLLKWYKRLCHSWMERWGRYLQKYGMGKRIPERDNPRDNEKPQRTSSVDHSADLRKKIITSNGNPVNILPWLRAVYPRYYFKLEIRFSEIVQYKHIYLCYGIEFRRTTLLAISEPLHSELQTFITRKLNL